MRKGFTLIELLIVVAIIAIISSGVMATLLAPIKEQVRSDFRGEMTRGGALFVSSITGDVHEAETIVTEPGAESLRLRTGDGRDVAYEVGEDRVLRRNGAALLPSVTAFTVADGSSPGSYLVRLEAGRTVMTHPVGFSCELELAARHLVTGEELP